MQVKKVEILRHYLVGSLLIAEKLKVVLSPKIVLIGYAWVASVLFLYMIQFQDILIVLVRRQASLF